MNNTLKYIIDKENRTITCIAEDCQGDLEYILLKALSSKNNVFRDRMDDLIVYSIKSYFSLPNTLQVTVTCKSEDIWNEEKGKTIARMKLRRKYHRLINKILLREKDILRQEMNFLSMEYQISCTYVDKYNDAFHEAIAK